MTKCYYSLIQVCPSFARAEAVNVGVLLFRPEPRVCLVRITDDFRHARPLLGRADMDVTSVQEGARSMVDRIRSADFHSVEDLEAFSRTRGNVIQVTLPRPARAEDMEQEFERLFDELVASESPVIARTLPVVASNLLVDLVTRLQARAPGRIEIRPRFDVALLHEIFVPDFAYSNGHLNLVQTRHLPKKAGEARNEAMRLNSLGAILNGALPGEGARLTVVSLPRGDAHFSEVERQVGGILETLRCADFVPSGQIQSFAEKVEREVLQQEQEG